MTRIAAILAMCLFPAFLPADEARPPVTAIAPPEADFFAKQLVYEGLPIKASAVVADEALDAAYDRLAKMLGNRPDVTRRLVAAGVNLHIIGRDQVTTDLPEWRHDKGRPLADYNGLTRDERTRGMGGRLVSCGEENLLGLRTDRYRGRDICVHEFAHAVRAYGMTRSVRRQFDAQYRRSLDEGRWKGAYAGSNADEFFAELSMWYFGTHGDRRMEGEKPADGPDGLKAYDPEAFALLDAFYSGQSQSPDRSAATGSTVYGVPIMAAADVEVETVVGHLPRLPLTVPVRSEDGRDSPEVRVIWPAPTETAQVRQAGTYTLVGSIPGTNLTPKAVVHVVPASDRETTVPPRSLEAFPLGAVTLDKDDHRLDTPFIRNRDKFLRGLADTNADSFLYMFRNAFGQLQPEGAQPLGVWDSQTTRLRGHASGHYLSALAQAYAGCARDEELRAVCKQKMDYMVDTLYELSQKSGRPSEAGGPCNADPAKVPPGPGRDAYTSDLSEDAIRTDYWNWGTGFLSAYPPDQFIMLEQGATYGTRNDQIWAPYYTLHKILAGLLDCYEIGGNDKALEISKDMGLWVYERLQHVPTETRIRMWNRYIAGEFGGMNEVMARLHRITGDERFLECAQMFDNIDFFFGDANHTHGLACNVDTVRGKHANQHIPQITGALEIYRSNLDPRYYRLSDNFWHICTRSYMYCIGGVAGASTPDNPECFTAEPGSLFKNGFSRGGQNETCATYNLLKLSRQLFMHAPDAEYMDYYEQALYNHILASVAEDNPGNTYHVPLNPASHKQFGNADMRGFTCCNGTALESSTKLQDSIYFKSTDNNKLYVNLFIPSTLTWKDRGIVLTQATSFPYSDRTKLTIDGDGPFTILVRVPKWATEGIHVSVNGVPQPVDAIPGEYVALDRQWKRGDTADLQLPMTFRLSRVMDQPNIASIFYGPVLLAVQESDPLSTWRQLKINTGNIAQSIQGDPATLRFQLGDLRLKPFFETYGRYSVYLDVVPE